MKIINFCIKKSYVIGIFLTFFACGAAESQDLKPYIIEAKALTFESNYYTPEFAFDGDYLTRWSSLWKDNQWIIGRFYAPCKIEEISIKWEAAYAKDYVVETSMDQKDWTELVHRTAFTGGTDTISLSTPVEASYLRIRCVKRETEWGNSIFEIDVKGIPGGSKPEKSLIGFEAAPSPWDARCREIRDKLVRQASSDPKTSSEMSDDEFLELVSRRAFDFFWYETNPENGLTLDQAENFRSSERMKIASVANTGFALTAYAIGAKRGWVTKTEAVERVKTTLKFYLSEKMKHEKGFYYHFLNIFSGELEEGTELSSIDSALFLCGVITVQEAFKDDPEIIKLADEIINRVNWKWMLNGHPYLVSHGVKDGKFLNARWGSTTEGILCYIIGLGASNNPLPTSSWDAFDRHLDEYSGYELVTEYAAQSIFRFQYPCLWYDFRNKHDKFCDYFENGIEATLAMRQYCISNADKYPKSYGPLMWGLGAANGPEDKYLIYGFPPGTPEAPVDGTVVIYGIAGSISFVPELAVSALRYIYDNHHESWGKYGFTDSINPTLGSVTQRVVGLDEGTILIAIENFRSGYVWDLFMSHPVIQRTTKAIQWTTRPNPYFKNGPINLTGIWKFKKGEEDFSGIGINDSDWTNLFAPDRWENQEMSLSKFDGTAWYRRTFELTSEQLAAWKRGKVVLHIGAIDEEDEAYVNGVKVGETKGENTWRQERIYNIPFNILKVGKNLISIKVTDKEKFGGIWRRPLRIGPYIEADWQPKKNKVFLFHALNRAVLPKNV